jgi:NhaP-type Na+/H+ or K+/H+ antiporter
VESGLNDGICVPIFTVVLAIASTEAGLISEHHAATLLAEQIGYGILLGAAAGVVGAAVVVLAEPRGFVDRSWLQIVPVAAAVLAYTSAAAVDGSGFIAAFVGGMVFGGLRRRAGGEVGYLVDELGALLAAATFVVFGATLLEPSLDNVTWAVFGYAVLSLTVVRMLPVAIAMAGTGARPPTLAFLGWFGPRGLASIVFAVLLVEAEGKLPNEGVLLTTIFVTIGLSVLLHGLTAAPLARRYARWYEAHPRAGTLPVESGTAQRVRWRGETHSP